MNKAVRMGTIPAIVAVVSGVVAQLGYDFPGFAPYATAIVGGIGLLATLIHPGLGGKYPWFAEDPED